MHWRQLALQDGTVPDRRQDTMDHDAEPPEPQAAETGEPRVDAAIAPLAILDELPVSEHPPVFERIHGQLVEVLGELHSGSGRTGQAELDELA
jgi:hypothetical protein